MLIAIGISNNWITESLIIKIIDIDTRLQIT
jgi:hypothetical protein